MVTTLQGEYFEFTWLHMRSVLEIFIHVVTILISSYNGIRQVLHVSRVFLAIICNRTLAQNTFVEPLCPIGKIYVARNRARYRQSREINYRARRSACIIYRVI